MYSSDESSNKGHATLWITFARSSNQCHQSLEAFKQTCQELGVAIQKIEGPSTSLTFLGIVLDKIQMEIPLPDDRLTEILLIY